MQCIHTYMQASTHTYISLIVANYMYVYTYILSTHPLQYTTHKHTFLHVRYTHILTLHYTHILTYTLHTFLHYTHILTLHTYTYIYTTHTFSHYTHILTYTLHTHSHTTHIYIHIPYTHILTLHTHSYIYTTHTFSHYTHIRTYSIHYCQRICLALSQCSWADVLTIPVIFAPLTGNT